MASLMSVRQSARELGRSTVNLKGLSDQSVLNLPNQRLELLALPGKSDYHE